MTPIYQLEDVSRTYGAGLAEVRALAGVDLRIDAGEFVAVAGPSGSGKTTLLQLLGALDRPTGGTLRFEGTDVRTLSDGRLTSLRRDALGFVFQQFNLIPTLSARMNVEVALAPTRMGSHRRREKATEMLALVGLGHRPHHLPSQMSGGEQQRVAIARALVREPHVLLADEPTGNLDSATGQEIIALLRSLNADRGLTVVLITHDDAIANAAPRLLRMHDGQLDPDRKLVAA